MTKVRNGLLQQIDAALGDNFRFEREDFLLKADSNSSSELINITYLPEKNYRFRLMEHTPRSFVEDFSVLTRTTEEKEKQLITLESPGEYKEVQKTPIKEFSALFDRLDTWMDSIYSEISYVKVYVDDEEPNEEVLATFEENISDLINEKNKDEKFSEQEINEIRERLEILENKILEAEKSEKISKSQAESVNKVLTKAEENLPQYARKIWYRQTAIRLLQAFKSVATSKEVREIASSVVKKLLGI